MLFKKVELKLSTLVRTPKINRVLKKLTYCCSSFNFLLSLFNVSTIFKSDQQWCSIKQAVFKNFAIFTGKHLQSLMPVTLYKKVSSTGVFLRILQNFCEIFKNTYFEEHLQVVASIFC